LALSDPERSLKGPISGHQSLNSYNAIQNCPPNILVAHTNLGYLFVFSDIHNWAKAKHYLHREAMESAY
jgi:hypothetical protein